MSEDMGIIPPTAKSPEPEPIAVAATHSLLDVLIERLYAGITRGPAINCTPGRSRQRADLQLLEAIPDVSGTAILRELMTGSGRWRKRITVEQLLDETGEDAPADEDKTIAAGKKKIGELKAVLRRLSTIADDAFQFQQDTGAHVLYLGYPLLSIPPSSLGFGKSPRVLAPLAFIPISVVAGKGSTPFVELSCAAAGAELVFMNEAVKVFLERQMGKKFPEFFEDEDGAEPARELAEICAAAATMLELPETPDLAEWPVLPVPDTADLPAGATILPSAVIGLFRLENQNMITDLQTLKGAKIYPPTVAPFLTLNVDLQDKSAESDTEGPAIVDSADQRHEQEFMVTLADPSQRQAVLMARSAKTLVVHGPPGTGKSQTIANIVGDYLARDRRVLVVCDKRTALDVVKNRLDHIGLGHLCAVVHDASRDRAALFKMARDRLDVLADTQPGESPEPRLKALNDELNLEQGKLREFLKALRLKGDAGSNFTELTGEWLRSSTANQASPFSGHNDGLSDITPEQLYQGRGVVEGVFRRGTDCQYELNPWRGKHGFTVQSFMSRNVAELRQALDHIVETAGEADSGRVADAPVLPAHADLGEEAARAEKLSALANALIQANSNSAVSVPSFSKAQVAAVGEAIAAVGENSKSLAVPLDAELRLGHNSAPRSLPEVSTDLGSIQQYLEKGLGLLGWFRFAVRAAAKAVTARYGLPLNEQSASRLKVYLTGLRSRILVQATASEYVQGVEVSPLMSDTHLSGLWNQLLATTTFLVQLDAAPGWESVAARYREQLAAGRSIETMSTELTAIHHDLLRRDTLLSAVKSAQLFNDEAILQLRSSIASGEMMLPIITEFKTSFERLDSLLRMEAEAGELPAPLGAAALAVAAAGFDGEAGWLHLVEPVMEGEIKRRLAGSPPLSAMDATAVRSSISRIQTMGDQKRKLAADWINWKWTDKQRTRLLAGTGSRLNSDGADLRRRLAIRGKNASRIRQVIQQGANPQGLQDPLFDLCPVWMASPETVAQLFPLEPVFDAVVFDEASQCRLEQGIGVLARGSQVIIAGDTRQLPPTRFFEAAVVSGAEGDLDSDDPDALFTSQQSDIEDLLTAALNIEVEQTFLEIHYRSSSSELIEFSNRAFYGGRLHALPARPDANIRQAPVRLHQIGGTYVKRQNEMEADHVVGLVREWLSKPEPPSIGIVTFNLTQKDLITDKLEEAALADETFGRLFEAARTRQGKGSFEGLFVKNLESVQGDERDVIILSCTYGPDTNGKFYRRFGPLALSGGERRLNVIITRARDVVEVVSSIPETEYMTLASAPDGTKPTGSWHFMDYLRYAREVSSSAGITGQQVLPDGDESANVPKPKPAAESKSSKVSRSQLTDTLAAHLLRQYQLNPVTYLGTEGFQIDMAFPAQSGDQAPSNGIQIDGSRYTKASDAAEWEVYQDGILKSRGWKPTGFWSPQIFRDSQGTIKAMAAEASPGKLAQDKTKS